MEWLVKLRGDSVDLERLRTDLASGTVKVIFRETDNKGYFLSAGKFAALGDADEVRNAAEELIPMINGIAKLRWADAQPVQFEGMIRVGDGREDVFVPVASNHMRMAAGTPTVRLGPAGAEQTPPKSIIEPAVSAAETDAPVAKALRILGSSKLNWAVLRRLYEVLEGDVGQPSRIEKRGWATQEEIKRFIESASQPEASGDEAVHGRSKRPLYYAPLHFEDGKAFVLGLLRRWVDSKLNARGS